MNFKTSKEQTSRLRMGNKQPKTFWGKHLWCVFYLSCCCWFLAACEKKEKPIDPYDRGDAITDSVDLGHLYRNQIWYDLHTSKVVSTNLKTDWDIAFCSESDAYNIKLNGAKAMFVYHTNATTFEALNSTSISNETNWQYDDASGDLSKTGIGDWRNSTTIYIIDRGNDLEGNPLGYVKIRFEQVDEQTYTISYADLDSTTIETSVVYKMPNYNFTYFSFSLKETVMIEPAKDAYDLVFTQYLNIFEEPDPSLPNFTPPFVYVVTGVLQNPNGVMVAVENNEEYNKINEQTVSNYQFEESISTIGWNWKTYSFDANAYVINPSLSYIIKDVEGFYYKLRFIDFYNSTGEKGHPTFEFQKL